MRMRTGKTIPLAGTWMIRCMTDGCGKIESIFLHEGTPAPPCRRCLNPAWVRFLHQGVPALATAALPDEAPPPPAAPIATPVIEPKAAGTAIRTGEIVPTSGTWLVRCDGCGADEQKIQHKGAWADPCSRCRKPARLFFLHSTATLPAKAAPTGSDSKPAVEAPAIAETGLSLMEKLTSTPQS